MEVQKVLTETAFVDKAQQGIVVNPEGKVEVARESSVYSRLTFGELMQHFYERNNLPFEGEPDFEPSKAYDVIQSISNPVPIELKNGGDAALCDELRRLYKDSVTKAGRKPYILNLQSGPISWALRHDKDGNVFYGSTPPPYNYAEEIGFTLGMAKETSGAIPLFVGRDGKALHQFICLHRATERTYNFINLTDGASSKFELSVPMQLERLYMPASAFRGGQDSVVLDWEALNTNGEVFTGKFYKYNSYFYGQEVLAKCGEIASIEVKFKLSSQYAGFKPRFALSNGVIIENNNPPADSVPVSDLSYVQLFALNSAPKSVVNEANLEDLTPQYSAAATGQAAAKAGTSVANLLSYSANSGWEAAAANQAANAFQFVTTDPAKPLLPKFVDIEFYTNAAYLGLNQVVVTTGYLTASEGNGSSNAARLVMDPAYSVDPAKTATIRFLVHPNNTQPTSNRLTIQITESNATAPMAIKSVRIYGAK